MPALLGTNHVNLTVRDLERSTEWYCRVFGLTQISNQVNTGPPYFNDDKYHGLFDLTTFSYVIGLIEHPETLDDDFDERRVGLDHVGFQVADRAELDRWATHLDEQGVAHSGVVEARYAEVINFRDPDGIAVELSVANMDFWTELIGQKLA